MSSLLLPGQFRPPQFQVRWQYGSDLRWYDMSFDDELDAKRYAARLMLDRHYRGVHLTNGMRTLKLTRSEIRDFQAEQQYDGPVGRYGMNGEPM